MLFVKNVSTLIEKAVALCDKAIKAANLQQEKALNKVAKLELKTQQQRDAADKAVKDRKVAEKLKEKLYNFTEEAIDEGL